VRLAYESVKSDIAGEVGALIATALEGSAAAFPLTAVGIFVTPFVIDKAASSAVEAYQALGRQMNEFNAYLEREIYKVYGVPQYVVPGSGFP
jgi:hypothetical protein